MATLLWQRDVVAQANDVKDTFSSWDKCMQKTYCKWPVIVVIIIASLIILSILWCFARCLCCGAECACCCFRCCAACCPSPSRRRGHKRFGSDQPPPQPHFNPGYNNQGYAPAPVSTQYRSPAAPVYEAPQYARFESSKPVNEDALPAMPSWNEAKSTKVEVEEPAPVAQAPGDMELKRLEPPSPSDPMLANAAGAPLRSPRTSPVHASPTQHSPTHEGYGYSNQYQQQSNQYARQGSYGNDNPSPQSYHSGQEIGVYGQNSRQGYTQRPYPRQDNRPYNQSNQQGYRAASPAQRQPYGQSNSYGNADYGHGANGYGHSGYAPYGSSYAPSESTRYEPSGQAYTVDAPVHAHSTPYPEQPAYQQPQWPSQDVERKPVNGSWRDI